MNKLFKIKISSENILKYAYSIFNQECDERCIECHKNSAVVTIWVPTEDERDDGMYMTVCKNCLKETDKIEKTETLRTPHTRCMRCHKNAKEDSETEYMDIFEPDPRAGEKYICTLSQDICQECFDKHFADIPEEHKKDITQEWNDGIKKDREEELDRDRERYPIKITLEYPDRYETLEGDDVIYYFRHINGHIGMSVAHGSTTEAFDWKKIMKKD